MTPGFVDSPAFDAKAYYEQLITTSSLATLLKRESELLSGTSRRSHSLTSYRSWRLTASWLCTEIRSLDSDRQSLVYNHNHELITTSDTISAVR